MKGLIVQGTDDSVFRVTALYDKFGAPTKDPGLAHSFDILDGLYTYHYLIPDAPDPSGFKWLH